MRKNLAKYEGKDIVFRAYFHRFGCKRGNSLSVLIEKVFYENDMVTEHSWIAYSDEFKNMDINSGDLISFRATVVKYEKEGSADFGFDNAREFKILAKSRKNTGIEDISYFEFEVKPEMSVWRKAKGDKKDFKHDSTLEIQEDVTIQPGDRIEIELMKIKANGCMEYAWKIERDGRWNKDAIYNPFSYGQALVVYGFYQIYLPESIYFAIKDFYFKLMFSKVDGIELPYKHEMKYYERPDKFKNRKFLNFNSKGEKIEDEAVLAKRDAVFRSLKDTLQEMQPEEILDVLEKTYGTLSSVAPYNNMRSPNYMNFEFLVTKTFNVFTSSTAENKRMFLDLIV